MPEMAPRRSLCRLWSRVFPFCGVMSGFPAGTARGSSFTICQREEKKLLEVAERASWTDLQTCRQDTQQLDMLSISSGGWMHTAYKRGGGRGIREGEPRGGQGYYGEVAEKAGSWLHLSLLWPR